MAHDEKDQQDFCKGTLDSVQGLIGQMDIKAGIILTVVGLFSAAQYALLDVFIQHVPVALRCNLLLVVVGIGYFIGMICVLWQTLQVFLARPTTLVNHSQAPRMIFPLLIMSTFRTDKDYVERAMKLSHRDIIADYANQIMECSNIYKLKHEHVNNAIQGLRWLMLPWLGILMIATWQIFVSAT